MVVLNQHDTTYHRLYQNADLAVLKSVLLDEITK